jgi:hypothetical protein
MRMGRLWGWSALLFHFAGAGHILEQEGEHGGCHEADDARDGGPLEVTMADASSDHGVGNDLNIACRPFTSDARLFKKTGETLEGLSVYFSITS